jgi:peptidylprolyl isomerase
MLTTVAEAAVAMASAGATINAQAVASLRRELRNEYSRIGFILAPPIVSHRRPIRVQRACEANGINIAALKRDQIIFVSVLLGAAVVAAIVILATGGDDSEESATATKPEVEVPSGAPPDELEIEDITVGDGAEAQAGDTVQVQYVGVNYSNGQEFDTSWDDPAPFSFQLGAGSVIPGWDEGVAGMKEGGRRQLIIPPDLGYGKQGQPPDIPPNETLIFVVDLLEVQAGP